MEFQIHTKLAYLSVRVLLNYCQISSGYYQYLKQYIAIGSIYFPTQQIISAFDISELAVTESVTEIRLSQASFFFFSSFLFLTANDKTHANSLPTLSRITNFESNASRLRVGRVSRHSELNKPFQIVHFFCFPISDHVMPSREFSFWFFCHWLCVYICMCITRI